MKKILVYAVVMAVAVILLSVVSTSTASASILCQTNSDALVVRAATCDDGDTAVDLAQFGAVTTIDSSLPSGNTEVGVFSGGFSLNQALLDGVAAEATIPISLRVPLAAPIPETNAIRVTGVGGAGGSAPHCPGKGQAEPGYFCLYETFNYSGATFIEFDNTFEGTGGISRYGTSLLYNQVGRRTIISGTWAVTAP